MPHIIKKIVVVMLLCSAVFLCLAGCQKGETSEQKSENLGSLDTKVKKFAESILNNAYSDAIAVYNSDINGNAGLEQEAADYMVSYLGEIESGVLSGAYSESDARTKMTTVKNEFSI